MNGRYAYLDTSAFVKLCWPEPESPALHGFLRGWPLVVSSGLLRTEASRAALRVSSSRMATVRRKLRDVALIEPERRVLDHAGLLPPPEVRSLDAIHLAAALSLGPDLGVVVTYDQRMSNAAREQGLAVAAPGLSAHPLHEQA